MKIEVYEFLAENPLKLDKQENKYFNKHTPHGVRIKDKNDNEIVFHITWDYGKICECTAVKWSIHTDEFKQMYADVIDAVQQSVLSKNSQQLAVFLHMRKMSIV